MTVFAEKFTCPEESQNYALTLDQFVFSRLMNTQNASMTVIEFGSGTGEPVASAIIKSGFNGIVHGYEINEVAAKTAQKLIVSFSLTDRYVVHNQSFFDDNINIPSTTFLIANPPYIPCENRTKLILPGLCGGPNGNEISKNLLSSGYANVLLEVSSYSDPAGLTKHAVETGYKITDFKITNMPFGVYSRQDIVQSRIHEMQKAGKAFFARDHYLVGSVLFTKEANNKPDLSAELIQCITALRPRNEISAPLAAQNPAAA